jgi:outer membrane protein OmpA-like peptidoglycan-associated protein
MAYTRPLLGVAFAALVAATAAHAQPYGPGPSGPGYGLAGPGVADLVPELRDTPRGRAFVMRNFDFDRDGYISRREAREANRAFFEMGPGRGRFAEGPGEFAGPPAPPPPPPPPPPEGWDRGAMRDYHFRQGREGATFTLHDVLFETASAVLRPEAQARLRPLGDFLRAHPRVRLRIDGYTDAVGSDASNLTLSRNRARSVADALEVMGVDTGRFVLDGHGKAMPVATNATAEGRQLNRRVEVTLIGERASTFQ